jgi:hypothetical protein
MNRRNFIRSALGVTILGLGGTTAYQLYRQNNIEMPTDDNFNYQFLNQNDLMVLQVLVPVFLSSELSINETDENDKSAEKTKKQHKDNGAIVTAVNISIVIQNIDSAIALLSQSTQQELRELLDLLASMTGRLLVARVWLDWQSAAVNSIDEFLNEWRESYLTLLQIAYRGLHKLVIGSFYAEASTWSSIGYAGPPQFALNLSSQKSSSKVDKVSERKQINSKSFAACKSKRDIS